MSDTPETDFHCWTDSSGEELIAVCKAEFCRKLERERDKAREKAERYRIEANAMMMQRDEARESLKHISEYGTDEINAAVELRQKLATALVERDEARNELCDIRLNLGEDAEGYTLTHAVCVLQNERNEAMEDSLEQARLLGMGSEREAKLISERDEARNECDKLKQLLAADSERVDAYLGVCMERDEARQDLAHWKSEWEIVEARLCGWKHPRDNGIIFEHEVIPVLRKERDEAREALMKIEDLFLECTDIYADFKNMGLIARAALEETK